MGMHIVVVGNPVDGFTFFGPFKTLGDAVVWAEESVDRDWCVAPLLAQN